MDRTADAMIDWDGLTAWAYRVLVSYLRRYYGWLTQCDCEDITGEALLRLWRAYGSKPNDEPMPKSLLLTTARRLIIDHGRAQRVRPTLESFADDLFNDDISTVAGAVRDPTPEPEAQTIRDETIQDVIAALAACSPKIARAVVRSYVLGQPNLEAAAAEGIPLGTLKARVRRGRIQITRRLGIPFQEVA